MKVVPSIERAPDNPALHILFPYYARSFYTTNFRFYVLGTIFKRINRLFICILIIDYYYY
jgi:hypothetical protein